MSAPIFLCHEMTPRQKRWALVRSALWGAVAGLALGAPVAADVLRGLL